MTALPEILLMLMVNRGLSVRLFLRTILAVALLLGSGMSDWMPATAGQPHDCCCGTVPAAPQDTCPCPKPEGNRGPQRTTCTERQVVAVAKAARRTEQGQRRREPRPEPTTWVLAQIIDTTESGFYRLCNARDPDLGRHLARLNALRI